MTKATVRGTEARGEVPRGEAEEDSGPKSTRRRTVQLYPSNEIFRRIAQRAAHGVGNPWAFVAAFVLVAGWAISGPLFRFSDTWQLVINTGTTIVTFLMVFLIQNTQNRDSHAIHLKLDELIRASTRARDDLIALEDLSDEELAELQREFDRLAKEKLASGPRPGKAARASQAPTGSA